MYRLLMLHIEISHDMYVYVAQLCPMMMNQSYDGDSEEEKVGPSELDRICNCFSTLSFSGRHAQVDLWTEVCMVMFFAGGCSDYYSTGMIQTVWHNNGLYTQHVQNHKYEDHD